MSIYLGLPNYLRNLHSLGFGDDDVRDGGSDRLVDAIVAWGDVDALRARVRAHHAAGADHVCVQVLPADPRALPLPEWRELAPALLEA
jgi:probable F420-dependent oxidoreductase